MTDGHHFNNILLGERGGTNPGQFKVHSGGLAWKRQGGGKTIEIDKADVTSVTWMKVLRAYQLGVRIKDGLFYRFIGFREQDVSSLTNFVQKSMGITPDEKQLSVSGHNWAGIDIDGNMLTFMVGSKQAFEVSLPDVAQTQMQGKTDVLIEFYVDDTTWVNEKDSLMDLSFHGPTSNTQFAGDENCPPAHILWETILKFADVGSSGEPVVTFDGIVILTPRGCYSVELHLSFLRLHGQANDFKIQYSSIVRLFLLPKSNNPHTFVVITLDPPIRKGQTLYPHIVIQFDTEAVFERDLALSKELPVDKYKDRLEESYKGLIHEVFTKVLRGLSGAKVTRPGSFRSCQDGYAVKSSLKAEDGLLYPLEKDFFFLPKPPTLILHEIEFVEFERHGAGGASISSHYFDLLVKLKNDQEHLFRNIQRNEYDNLFNFINGKNMKIMNLGGDGQGASGVVTDVLQDTDDDAVDPHLERIKNQAGHEESDEEDVSSLTNFIQKNMGITPDEKQLSVSGHNWGGINIDGVKKRICSFHKHALLHSMACQGQLQLSKYLVISDSNKSDGNQTIPPPLRSKAIRLGLGRKIMRGRKRKWDNKNGSSQPSNRASHGNPSPVHVRIGQLLELPDTIRPIEFGTRSKMDAKPWTCQTCGQINQPIRYIIADLPPLNCTNNKCKSPINAEYEFSFTMERLLVNGICPVGNVKDQGTTDECALNSTCSALEITKRMSKVLLGEAPPGEFGEGPTISTKGLLKTYEQMMSLHDINNGWQDEKFNSTTLDAVCDIAICEGIKDLDDEHAMHKAAGKRRVPLDFGEISKKLANGTPLIAVINPGKKFSELKNGQIYKAPKDTTGKKSVDHAIVLIGAGKRRRCFFYHFLNSHGELYCLRRQQGSRGFVEVCRGGIHSGRVKRFVGGFGRIRAGDLLCEPIEFLRYKDTACPSELWVPRRDLDAGHVDDLITNVLFRKKWTRSTNARTSY